MSARTNGVLAIAGRTLTTVTAPHSLRSITLETGDMRREDNAVRCPVITLAGAVPFLAAGGVQWLQ